MEAFAATRKQESRPVHSKKGPLPQNIVGTTSLTLCELQGRLRKKVEESPPSRSRRVLRGGGRRPNG